MWLSHARGIRRNSCSFPVILANSRLYKPLGNSLSMLESRLKAILVFFGCSSWTLVQMICPMFMARNVNATLTQRVAAFLDHVSPLNQVSFTSRRVNSTPGPVADYFDCMTLS